MSATTPRRANMAPSQNPTKSPSRRVLGDLPPKAINTPSKQASSFDAMRAQSPLKQVQTMSPHVLVDQENVAVPGALHVGKKRSIYEVEDAENVDDTRVVSGEFRRGGAVHLPLGGESFEVGKEEVDVGSPTEAATPTPEPEDDIQMGPQPSQETNKSFSEYLNFSACESQQSDHAPPAAPEPEARKPSRAEMLKTRLGFARYKVDTHQIAKPSLEILSTFDSMTTTTTTTTSTSLTTSHSTTLPTEPTSSASSSQPLIPSITVSPVHLTPTPVPTFIIANIDKANSTTKTFPKLSFIPSLPETEVGRSSRMIGAYNHGHGPPSSPPDAQMMDLPKTVSPEQILSPTRTYARYLTPVPRRRRGGAGYGDEEGDVDVDMEDEGEGYEEGRRGGTVERIQRARERRFEEGDLTSSVVKGVVAKGLLELMQGGRR
ncbi:hypothetical protein P154DRAFT_562468 [Amniculicola lignicola CBS 123094]|uniref:Uncharacterized protein n=1 Tax=Amniculicola lignicola CBS 123094 TaxID=1392246 RepID=A0A6A5WJY4_9PLEO|nr:hypothetical protein P154DRAFT_562468 [Amniculicola lignicola CBS 123094]